MTGYIPTHVTFISRAPETIVNEWEDGTEINSFEARATYVATNEKTKESGMSWAQGYASTKRGITVTESENKPFSSLRVISHEKRNEGGGAFKAIADGKWYVDLRTDTLLDLLVNQSIKGGEVQGAEFVWARIGSQAKVVRVGSSLHAKMIEATETNDAKPPKANDLKVGDVYEAKNGDKGVFLGWVSTIEMTHYGTTSYDAPYIDPWSKQPQHEVTLKRAPKVQCWYRVNKWEEETVEKAIKDWAAYRVDFKRNSTLRRKLPSVKVPEKWMSKMRAEVEECIKRAKAEYSKGFVRPCDLASWCEMIHAAPLGEQMPLHEEYAEYKELLK
jgi:hypothetical protein